MFIPNEPARGDSDKANLPEINIRKTSSKELYSKGNHPHLGDTRWYKH